MIRPMLCVSGTGWVMAGTDEHERQKQHNELVLSFLAVRRCIGALGFFLPLALIVYALFSGEGLRLSISGYYYSPMREVFVGTLLAQAVFLWSYEGYRERRRLITDQRVARIAAGAIALVALSPTYPHDAASKIAAPEAAAIAPASGTVQQCLVDQSASVPAHNLLQCLLGPDLGPRLHLIAAGVFFAALAVYCLVLFVRGPATTREEAAEHCIYRRCGWIIIASITLIGLLVWTGLETRIGMLRPIFWLETVACFAFATSWAIKGQTLRPVVRMVARRSPEPVPPAPGNAAPPADGQ